MTGSMKAVNGEAGFTPGPWRADTIYAKGSEPPLNWRHEVTRVVMGPHGDIAYLYNWNDKETEATANLISAAPDLLEALMLVTDKLERVGDSRKDESVINHARKAIAKALFGKKSTV